MSAALTTLLLFVATAVAELVVATFLIFGCAKAAACGCCCRRHSAWRCSSGLLTLHPAASGRVYAAYGGVYIATALLWLWWVDRVTPTRWDLLGAGCCLLGMAIIMFSPRSG